MENAIICMELDGEDGYEEISNEWFVEMEKQST